MQFSTITPCTKIHTGKYELTFLDSALCVLLAIQEVCSILG